MKKVALIAILISSIYANEDSILNDGIKYIKIFAKELKSNLKEHLKADKTALEAAKFCANNATKIAKEVSKKFPKGVIVYRTSQKYRNIQDKPDKIDTEVLKDLENKYKQKIAINKPFVKKVNDNEYRVYKPLFIEPVCLKCHGDINKIDPKIKSILAKKYPNDLAINYKVGDLRGVIVAKIKK